MKKTILLLPFLLWGHYCLAQNSLKIGDTFPLHSLSQDSNYRDNTLVVFMPSLTKECSYASMLTQAFSHYFGQQLAFENLAKKPLIKMILVLNESPQNLKLPKQVRNDFEFIHDEQAKYYKLAGIEIPKSRDANAHLFLLDKDSKIMLLDTGYRGQGEHLKPLEYAIRKSNQIPLSIAVSKPKTKLRVGQKAPNFKVNDSTYLADLKGSVVLLSFYPAAFSGTLPPYPYLSSNENIHSASKPKPNPEPFIVRADTHTSQAYVVTKLDSNATALVVTAASFNPASLAAASTCYVQTMAFEFSALSRPSGAQYLLPVSYWYLEQHRFMISESTPSLLEQWEKTLDTKSITYVNDADYSIAQQYFSYNYEQGYNNRVSVVIDENGKIALIDWDYTVGDEAVIQDKMEALSKKERSVLVTLTVPYFITISHDNSLVSNRLLNSSHKKIGYSDKFCGK